MINGVTELCMTKADVLSGLEKLQVCTHYMSSGQKIDYMPYDIQMDPVEPVYVELDGWKEVIQDIHRFEELPSALQKYTEFIEHATGVPVTIISTGSDRNQILHRDLAEISTHS